MGGEGIEVEVEPITGEQRDAAWGQHLSQGVYYRMGHVLGAGTQLEHWQYLRARIDDQPEPLHLCMAAQPRAQFVQLQVREPQMSEGPLVQGLGVLACTREPPHDGRLTRAEDAFGSRRVQPFSQRGEHHGDLL